MNIDSATIFYATKGPQEWKKVREIGIDEDLFLGQGKEAWRFVKRYRDEHGQLPSPGIVSEHSGLHVLPFEEGVTITYLADQLHERAIFRALQHGLGLSQEALEKGDIDTSGNELDRLQKHLRGLKSRRARVKTLADVAPEVWELYQQTKRGETGVPFPWPTMTEMTMGMWPGTLTFFVARPGVGKSWTAVIIAWTAWTKGLKILIVSPEMRRVELGERVVSKHGKFSYGDVVGATLGTFRERDYKEVCDELADAERSGSHRFCILDDEERLGPEYIEEAVEAEEPDIVLVDSVYMLRVEQGMIKKGAGSKGGRYDRILATVDWMRSSSRSWERPVVGVSQLSRDVKKIKKKTKEKVKKGQSTGGIEDALAMTDTLFWDCNNLFALWQDEDMRLAKQMLYVPLKVRRQAKISGVVANWDMSEMNFDEIGTKIEEQDEFEDKSYYDDDVPY